MYQSCAASLRIFASSKVGPVMDSLTLFGKESEKESVSVFLHSSEVWPHVRGEVQNNFLDSGTSTGIAARS